MKILVVGSGAREHALASKLAAEPGVSALVCAPGNAGIARTTRCLPVDLDRPGSILDLARTERVDLTVIGPEAPLARGVADEFEAEGRPLVGPGRSAARLETSKVFAKEFMARHGVPTAPFTVIATPEAALGAIDRGDLGWPLVVKADGLAAGKGVVVAPDRPAALQAVREAMVERRFGAAGDRLVLETCLRGVEASFFVLADGEHARVLPSAQDHKRALDGDRGPNTGGMGAFAPSPLVDEAMRQTIMTRIVEPVLGGLRAERILYRGFLYVGLMMTREGPQVIEFNVRFGDPEAQVVLPMIRSELAPLLAAAATGDLAAGPCEVAAEPHVGVVLASDGYPGAYEAGRTIEGLEAAAQLDGVEVFHAGTAVRDDRFVTAGGRVLTVVGWGADFESAIARAYQGVSAISFEGMHYRTDIGQKALEHVRA